jgi:hypothetical protein
MITDIRNLNSIVPAFNGLILNSPSKSELVPVLVGPSTILIFAE